MSLWSKSEKSECGKSLSSIIFAFFFLVSNSPKMTRFSHSRNIEHLPLSFWLPNFFEAKLRLRKLSSFYRSPRNEWVKMDFAPGKEDSSFLSQTQRNLPKIKGKLLPIFTACLTPFLGDLADKNCTRSDPNWKERFQWMKLPFPWH